MPKFVEGVLAFGKAKNPYADRPPYDILHSHYWMSGMAALQLRQTWHIPVVHMFHTLGMMKQRVARLPGEAEGDYRLMASARCCARLTGLSPPLRLNLPSSSGSTRLIRGKIVIIPPGVDTSHFYPIPEDEAKEVIGVPPCDQMLLFVGRIEPLKGIDTLIQAMAHPAPAQRSGLPDR